MKHSRLTTIAIIIVAVSVIGIMASDYNDLAWNYVKKLNTYLATPDRSDYSEDFYYQNYLTSLKSRYEMPWGKSVPEREFEHFVLPVRVNNENLDTARIVFYRELKEQVKDLSMKEAILEVNHWCHEKVSYRPSDARTSSPLATVRTAYGRCGEESTFLVAALRSVCIPARQVYTPRWAHTDDNHAWVEAWADGKWYFLGACEPEPVLNLGWFNESASRGMLMHTKVFGAYDGPEEVMSRTPCYTEINVTDHYTPTSLVEIKVIDVNGKPVNAATVEFKLYNYAEFYTVAKKTTDDHGATFLTAGRGDLLVWVTKDDLVAVKKVSWRKSHNEIITLKDKSLPQHLDLDIVPPPANAVLPQVTTEQRATNDRRKAQEDSIRQAYEVTMPVEAWRGNHRTIQQFLDEAQNKVMAHKLLQAISAKDMRDITLDVLRDNEVALIDTNEIYCRYVLNPRVENEWLTPYKNFFHKEFSGKFSHLDNLVDWTKNNITIDEKLNPQRLRQQPMSVYRTRTTDKLGRAIFFVSAARSMGWPARINEVDGKLEFYVPVFHGGSWHEVHFEEDYFIKPSKSGILKLKYTPDKQHSDLAYYTHFTLSRIEEGKAQLLTYPEDATWEKSFKNGVALETGTYLLTTGNRQSDGSVLANMTTFEIKNNTETVIDLSLREKNSVIEVIAKIKTDGRYRDIKDNTIYNVINKDGYTIIGVIKPNHEPTNHALNDISTYANVFEAANCPIVLLHDMPFKSNEFNKLPATTKWGIPENNLDFIWNQSKELDIDRMTFPVFLLCDHDGNVFFVKQGYTIHLGEQLLKVIKKLQEKQ